MRNRCRATDPDGGVVLRNRRPLSRPRRKFPFTGNGADLSPLQLVHGSVTVAVRTRHPRAVEVATTAATLTVSLLTADDPLQSLTEAHCDLIFRSEIVGGKQKGSGNHFEPDVCAVRRTAARSDVLWKPAAVDLDVLAGDVLGGVRTEE